VLHPAPRRSKICNELVNLWLLDRKLENHPPPDQAVTSPLPNILLVGSDNPTTWIIYNHLVREFGLFGALIEQPASRKILLRNRIRKLGFISVLGQVAFITLIRPILMRRAKQQIATIMQSSGMEPAEPMTGAIRRVVNINNPSSIEQIREANPKIVIVNGTRILKPATLQAGNATFINTHQGITPRYRGAHGAYWALYENNPSQCGVTIHVVDQGIDTGNIISQAIVEPGPDDSFVTYPYLQTAAALPLLVEAIHKCLGGSLQSRPISGSSAVWYHPGALQYLKARLRGIK
jgi:folate-dependent phosphoribosylglycinamide formyltransferase PurN